MGGGGTCALKDVLQPFSYKNNPILRMGEKRWGGGGGGQRRLGRSPQSTSGDMQSYNSSRC